MIEWQVRDGAENRSYPDEISTEYLVKAMCFEFDMVCTDVVQTWITARLYEFMSSYYYYYPQNWLREYEL